MEEKNIFLKDSTNQKLFIDYAFSRENKQSTNLIIHKITPSNHEVVGVPSEKTTKVSTLNTIHKVS